MYMGIRKLRKIDYNPKLLNFASNYYSESCECICVCFQLRREFDGVWDNRYKFYGMAKVQSWEMTPVWEDFIVCKISNMDSYKWMLEKMIEGNPEMAEADVEILFDRDEELENKENDGTRSFSFERYVPVDKKYRYY